MKKVLVLLMVVIVIMLLCSTVALAADSVEEAETPSVLDVFVTMVVLAVLIESIAEMIKAAIAPAALKKWVWLCITAAMGVALCILFGVDLLAALGFTGIAAAIIVSEVLTGIAVGAGSSFVHVLLVKLNSVQSEGITISGYVDEIKESTDSSDDDSDG